MVDSTKNEHRFQLEDLGDDGLHFFKNAAQPLWELHTKDLIDFYNSSRRDRFGYEGILPAEYTYEYNKICRDTQRRIVRVRTKGDEVIVILKKVQMFKNVYNRIEGLPVSVNGDDKSIRTTLDELSKKGLAQKISAIPEESEILTTWGFPFSEKIDSFNFYSHLPTQFEKMSKAKWMHKKGVKRLLRIDNLSIKVLEYENKSDKEDVETLNRGFDEYKLWYEGISKGWKKLQSSMSKYPYWDDENTICYLVRYKGFPVAYAVYIYTVSKTVHLIISKSIGRNLHENYSFTKEEKTEWEEIKKKISAYTHYRTTDDLLRKGVIHGYYGGAFSMKSLRTFKKIMYDNEITHFVHKLQTCK